MAKKEDVQGLLTLEHKNKNAFNAVYDYICGVVFNFFTNCNWSVFRSLKKKKQNNKSMRLFSRLLEFQSCVCEAVVVTDRRKLAKYK